MLRKAFLVVAALMIMPWFARAEFQTGSWELTLGGAGSSNKGLTQGTFSINGSLGYFLTKDLEVALRQSVGYTDFNQGTTISASTRVALDWHFDLGKWRPFIGGNIGYSYGTNGFSDTWEGAPEAGVKYFINSTTFAYGMVEYQIFFAHHHGSFSDGAFVYSLGLGVLLN